MEPNARDVSLGILVAREEQPSRATSLDTLHHARDRAFCLSLVSGCVRWQRLIDWYLEPFSKRPITSLTPRLRNALRLGVLQLVFLGIPPHASVDSTVRCLQRKGERAYCNAVLREITRRLGHVEMPSLDQDPIAYLSVRYSYPNWLAKLFIQRFGLRGGLLFADLGNHIPQLSLRIQTELVSRSEFLKNLCAHGYDAEEGKLPQSVKIVAKGSVTEIPGYAGGHFVVQDEGAMAVSLALGPKAGDRVWDVCSAPGGKTTHLASLVGPSGSVLATDIDSERIKMVKDSLERLGISNVTARAMDATAERPKELFDKVLLDAPCSGLGVIRRHPDIRWNRRPKDIVLMAERQKKLLENAASRVRPGGALVYSTCTITKEENERVWQEFLVNHGMFVPEDPGCGLPKAFFVENPDFLGEGYRYLLPHYCGTDGFFVAKAIRKDDNK